MMSTSSIRIHDDACIHMYVHMYMHMYFLYTYEHAHAYAHIYTLQRSQLWSRRTWGHIYTILRHVFYIPTATMHDIMRLLTTQKSNYVYHIEHTHTSILIAPPCNALEAVELQLSCAIAAPTRGHPRPVTHNIVHLHPPRRCSAAASARRQSKGDEAVAQRRQHDSTQTGIRYRARW